jgi:hypothetical protein
MIRCKRTLPKKKTCTAHRVADFNKDLDKLGSPVIDKGIAARLTSISAAATRFRAPREAVPRVSIVIALAGRARKNKADNRTGKILTILSERVLALVVIFSPCDDSALFDANFAGVDFFENDSFNHCSCAGYTLFSWLNLRDEYENA